MVPAWESKSIYDAVSEAAARYRAEGQYRPWQDYQLAREER